MEDTLVCYFSLHFQYYATVDPGREFSVDKLNWLTKDNIDDSILDAVHHSALLPGEVSPGLLETTIPEMMRSGQSVGGVVNTPLQQEQVSITHISFK